MWVDATRTVTWRRRWRRAGVDGATSHVKGAGDGTLGWTRLRRRSRQRTAMIGMITATAITAAMLNSATSSSDIAAQTTGRRRRRPGVKLGSGG